MLDEIDGVPPGLLHDQKTFIGVYRGYTIIKIKDDKKENVHRYYAYHPEKDKQGEGSFGKVYAARIVDPATGKFKADTVAVKVIGAHEREMPQELYEKKCAANKEAKRLRSKHILAETPFLERRQVFVIMEFAKGKELDAKEFAQEVNYVFPEAAKLVLFLSRDLNRLHHQTSRGRALIHSDLKAGNSRVEVVHGKTQDARIIDFGLSRKIRDDAMHLVADGGGTYLAPEQEKEKIQGLKSDIYSFGLMCQSIFHEFENTIPENLKPILHGFLLQMIQEEYHARPHADEVLIFFTALGNYCIAEVARRNEFLEKLEVMAIPEEVLRRKDLPTDLENCWRLFLYASEYYENHQDKWIVLNAFIKREAKELLPDLGRAYAWVSEFVKGYEGRQFSEEQRQYFFQFLKEFLQVNHPRREESKRCIRILLQHNEKEWQKIVETRSIEENPVKWLRERAIPQLPHNQWRLFVCAATYGAEMVNNKCIELKQALVQNRAALAEEQCMVEKAITDFFSHSDAAYRESNDEFFRFALKKYLDEPTPKRLESVRVIANPEALLVAKEMPKNIRNIWRLFIAASQNYEEYKDIWELCRVRIQKNIDEKKGNFGPDDQQWFKAECRSRRSPVAVARK